MALTPEAKQSALSEYFDECYEMLERLNKNVSIVEKNGSDKEILAAIYRDMHTLKGSSQLFGFAKIGRLAHVMETCLDPIRKGKTNLSPELLDSIYIGLDFITFTLDQIKDLKKEPDSHEELEKIFAKFLSSVELSITNLKSLSKDKILLTEETFEYIKAKPSTEETTPVSVENKNDTEIPSFEIFDMAENPVQSVTSATRPVVQSKLEEPQTSDKKNVSDEQISETIRVQVNLLNNLMNLVGELVLIRNQLLQHAKFNDDDTDFLKMSQRLNLLTAELQNEVMKTRMQPIGNVLTIFTRVVRDISKELGKKIDLNLQGIETELDKTVIEAVKDPLMHIVRNAVDHGIETAEERKKEGKKETALIILKAYNESGQVIIEIIDDGRGIDKEKIGAKAVEKGIITKETLSKMTEKEVQLLIFTPGFSTADVVSNISGRGVGMDVVKTNVERIGGLVDLFSVPGKGTTIIIKIPLSLAIIPALIVHSEGQQFAIPQTKLVELLRIDNSETNSEKIENLQGQAVLRLRGKLLPVISLAQVLFNKRNNLNFAEDEHNKLNQENIVSNVVILNADNFLFGLIVDEINDSADIVVKSLSQFLKDLKVFSGATIMGDGTVALTIDVLGIAEIAKISIVHTNDRPSSHFQNKLVNHYHSDICEYLLIDAGAPSAYAIPLSIVNRLEEFETERFELSGEQKVIRYRNSLLPILSLPDFLELPFENSKTEIIKERTPIVVIKRGHFSYGIEVREIYDIIEVSSEIDQSVKDRPGILGTIVTNEQIIVIADIFGMIDIVKSNLESQSHPHSEIVHEPQIVTEIIKRQNHRILLVEDSSFFRKYIHSILLEAGYLVETAYDGANGLEILESSLQNHFSLILSDIEMPIMDGLEFAKHVRSSKNHSKIPMIAITTKYTQNEIQEGLSVGFSSYLEKLRAEKLIAELDLILIQNKTKEKN
ncbi:chemotaxis protein CheW [Fluviispira multicolorata]|uniref:histidine kinase n=1 Tax=Fluviispira multicolorata TaxID=2654512 RepID=A0A833JBR5_9BACT|nr:chemotaxis protein CheW [Fluviispira multicolorata]KAB8029781.1 response regulator [Fluviispira multicolorata]